MLLIFLGFILPLNMIFAEESLLAEAQHIEILYEQIPIKTSQIFFCNKEIFVLLENGLERVNSIEANINGVYAGKGYWVCPRCNGKNELYTRFCAHCDYVLPK